MTFASGYTHGMTWRRFIVADVCAGLLWGTYAAMLGYLGGKTFEDAPWKGLLLGFVIAIVAVAVAWWLLNRSTLGYRVRAVGENPHAARASGINVGRIYIVVMMISGSLLGLAGVNQVLGTVCSGVSLDLDAAIGFDAITVALLGRSRPLGILAAGLLFGAFKAGGFTMQTSENISVDLVLVVQSLIVLFLAAPPLVRAIFRLPAQEAK